MTDVNGIHLGQWTISQVDRDKKPGLLYLASCSAIYGCRFFFASPRADVLQLIMRLHDELWCERKHDCV